jgi:hypothetical protein
MIPVIEKAVKREEEADERDYIDRTGQRIMQKRISKATFKNMSPSPSLKPQNISSLGSLDVHLASSHEQEINRSS